MANLYMGRGGLDNLFSPVMPQGPVNEPLRIAQKSPPGSPGPIIEHPQTSNPPGPAKLPPNVLGAHAVRATGPSKGYDPAYLQNLATSIGGLFSGKGSFNPLGNLNEISPRSGLEGNAPGPGEPLTWLQQALNGIAFAFRPKPVNPAPHPHPIGGGVGSGGFGGGEPGGRGGGGRIFL